jgi:hypothetical protein
VTVGGARPERCPTRARAQSTAFQLEAHLCATLHRELVPRLARMGHQVHVYPEVHVGMVVPDLLALRASRVTANVARLSNIDSWVIAELLPGQPRRPETIARRLCTNADKLMVRLAELQRKGVVNTTESGSFVMARHAFTYGAELIAVEAKLNKWRDAVDQASQYLQFSNRSYVALPSDVVRKNRNALLGECAKMCIGLIAVDRNEIRFVVRAPFHKQCNGWWVWAVAKMVRRFSQMTKNRRGPSAMHSDA